MAGVEQQEDRRSGRRHHRVDVGRRLHNRAHVVVKAEAHALGERHVGKLGPALADVGPLVVLEHRALRLRLVVVRVGGLGEDEDIGAERLEEIEMRAQALHLLLRRPAQQFAGIPARDEVEPMRGENFLERHGLARKLVAELHPLEAGLLGLRQALFERRVAAEFRHVVIRPADGVRTETDWHQVSLRE